MITRIRRNLSFANVIAVIALFIALGGGAYAAKKLNGKTIANNSIPAKKLKKSVLKNLDKCPRTRPNKVAGICYGPAQTAAIWDTAAQQVCEAAESAAADDRRGAAGHDRRRRRSRPTRHGPTR